MSKTNIRYKVGRGVQYEFDTRLRLCLSFPRKWDLIQENTNHWFPGLKAVIIICKRVHVEGFKWSCHRQ